MRWNRNVNIVERLSLAFQQKTRLLQTYFQKMKTMNHSGVRNAGKIVAMKDEPAVGRRRGVMTDYRIKYLALQSRLDQCESLLRDGVALMDATKEIVIMMANAIALHHKEHPESKVTVTDKRLWKIVQEMEEKGWLKKQ